MSKGSIDERKRNGKKCLAFVAVFAVFQIASILLIALVFMRSRSPQLRFDSIISIDSLMSNTMATTSPSISMRLLSRLAIKNPNFGRFKYGNSTLNIMYRGMIIGNAAIPKGRVGARKTKKIEVLAEVDSDRLPSGANYSRLGQEIDSGVITLSSHAELSGKVRLMMVFKKKKSAEMNCSFSINLSRRSIENLQC